MLALLHFRGHFHASRDLLQLTLRNARLLAMLSRREITDRHEGQALGPIWSIAHPVSMIIVYAVVFGFLFKARFGGTIDLPLDYTTFIISGLIPWLAFAEGLNKSATVIVAHTNLVKQVIFPLEVLPMKSTVATMFTATVLLSALLIYVVAVQQVVFWTFLLLPLLLILQAMMLMGFVFAISAVAVYFRDSKELVQLFCLLNLYFLPTIYPPGSIPPGINALMYANPFSYPIWCFQDALFYGRIEHPWAWLALAVMAPVSLVTGYRLFRLFKVMFGNVL